MDLNISPERKSFWAGRRTFVTGCTGVLGSWLTRTLVESGADVVGLVRDWVPNSELVRSGTDRRITIVRGDVADADLIDRTVSEYEINSTFHLAAQTLVGIANRMPVPTFETNIKGTWNILEAARKWPGTERVVVASSDKAYGEHEILPYDETSPLQGRHPYDVSKSCADLISLAYAQTYGLPVAITRCGNIYGGGDLNWNRIVPGTIRSILQEERPIIRSDGTPQRDYVFVLDIVDAYLTLAEAMIDGVHTGEAFNFGQNNPMTAVDIVNLIVSLSPHPELTPIVQNNAPNEIQNQYLDSGKAETVLGWKSRYTIEDGLTRTIGWYTDFFAGT